MPTESLPVSLLLRPVLLLSVVMVLWSGTQTFYLIKDHASLVDARAQQDKPLEQVEKIKAQLGALTKGVIGLAQKGDKDALAIEDRLKKIGFLSDAPAPSVPQP